MSYRISILDKSPLAAGETAAQALARTLTLAQQAEAWGYHRFWIAEHHNTEQLASPSPELAIAWILGQTRRIRVGSGGVMLQHYSPYKVAENFNMLSSLAPGRVDLGVGKAPGGLPLSTRALQQGLNPQQKGSFADQLAQLDNWLSLTETDGEESVRATPIPPRRADGFLLGASLESAQLAAQLDWNFVFAAHLNGDKHLLREVLTRWRELSRRDAIIAVQAVVADDSATAADLANAVEVWGVELENGQRVTVGSEAQAAAFARQAGSRPTRIARRESAVLFGTPEQVKAQLDGAALLLKQREAQLAGRVRILFQPAEESFGGAKTLIRAGVLEGVSAIFGMHNEPGLPVGEFATRGGAFYANVDRFVFKVTGKGAHAARPHEGKDAILLASQLVTLLQSVASREVNTLDSVVLSVTRIQGGNTWNVLPESVELEGTLRTHSSEVQQRVKARVSEIAAGFASAFGAQIDVFWYAGPTALVNDERWAAFASDVADKSGYRTHHADLHLGGEDFAVYLQHIPGAFVSIGSASEFGLHHPAFNPDERLIAPAAHYFADLAEQALKEL